MPRGIADAQSQQQIAWAVKRIIQGRHKRRPIAKNTVVANCLGKTVGFCNQVVRELLARGYKVQEDKPGAPGGNVRLFTPKVQVAGVAKPVRSAKLARTDYATLLQFVSVEAVLQVVCAHFRVTKRWLCLRQNRAKLLVKVAVFLLTHDTQELSTTLAVALNLEDHEFEDARNAMIARLRQDRRFCARLEQLRSGLFQGPSPRSLERTYGGVGGAS